MKLYLSIQKKFDGIEMKDFRVSEEEIQQASMFVENSFLEALKEAKKNIVSYHEKQKKHSIFDCESKGIIRGQLILLVRKCRCICTGWDSLISFFSINECIAGETRRCEKDCNGNTAEERRN